MKKKVLAGIMTTAMVMAMMTGCGSTDATKDTQAAGAADGASELMADRINELDDRNFAEYLRWHFYICEKKEFLGMTNHLLFVCEK